jgi:hypothetical protein
MILRRIHCPVKDNGQWRIKYNMELYELCGEADLVTCTYQTEKASMGGAYPKDGMNTSS